MKTVSLLASLICLVIFAPEAANAKTLTFTWSGSQKTTGIRGTGRATLTFPDGLTEVRMTDLTSFFLSEIEDDTDCGGCHAENVNGVFISNFTLGLANVTSFSLTLVNGVPTGLLIQTDNVDGPAFKTFNSNGDTVGGFLNAVGPVTFTP
jgi:hypothetical protein